MPLCLVVVLASGAVPAVQPAPNSPVDRADALVTSAKAPVAAPAGPKAVVLALRGDTLPRERLRERLAKELGQTVVFEEEPRPEVSGVVTVTYRQALGELAVTWDDGGRTVSRVIEAPSELDAVIESSAFLSGNLAREQTEDWSSLPRAETRPVATAAPPSAPAPLPRDAGAERSRGVERVPVTASVFYPLATHSGRPEVTSSLDLNVLYGRVGAVEGLQLGVLNVVTRSTGSVPASVQGAQLALFGNFVRGDLSGLQLSPLLNVTAGELTGLQAALGANLSQRSVHGVQAAFGFNRAGSLTGVQIAPINVAGDVSGVQIGLVNVARNVRGASIGLVNVADEIDGMPLAPVSVTKTGGVHPCAWTGSSGLGNVGVKFATRRTYTLFFASYHYAYERELLGGGAALGGRVALGGPFHADIDLAATYLVAPQRSIEERSGDGYREQLVQPRLRMTLGFRAAKHFGLFLGGAAFGQARLEHNGEETTFAVGPEILAGVEL